MTTTTYGKHYDSNLSNTDIAKRIRADLKAAIKAGELPAGLKTSVTSSSYAGGQSINLRVTACPGLQVWTDEYIAACVDAPYRHFDRDRFTPEAVELLRKLGAIHAAYNYDGSDIQSDYFNVNYYGSATLCSFLTCSARESQQAALLAARVAAVVVTNDAANETAAPAAEAFGLDFMM